MLQIQDDFLKDQTAADDYVDWWLWQKAHEALRIQFNKPSFSLVDCVREIQWLKLGMIPIVVAKAEHILGLCDGDNEAYEFVHGYRPCCRGQPVLSSRYQTGPVFGL